MINSKKTTEIKISFKYGVSICILFIGFIFAFHIGGLTQSLRWAKRIGGTGWDESHSIALDTNGNIYTTGYFEGNVDFDPGPAVYNLTSLGSKSMFIYKSDPLGNLIYAKKIGVPNQGGFQIVIDLYGNPIIAGKIGLSSSGNIFVSQLDSVGNIVWSKTLQGYRDKFNHSLSIDVAGNILLSGYFEDVMDFDPGSAIYNLTSFGGKDIFICKLDPFGNFLWAKQMGSVLDEEAHVLKVDKEGSIYTTGYFRDSADFDPGISTYNLFSSGGLDAFVSKLDSAGNFVWAKKIGGPVNDVANSLDLDAMSNIYLTGYFRGTCDFDPGVGIHNVTSNSFDDVFITKLDSGGNFISTLTIGGPNNEIGDMIYVDKVGNIYITGTYRNTIDLDPGIGVYKLTSVGYKDIFILKLNSFGNFISAKTIGGLDDQVISSFQVDVEQNIYLTGYFNGTTDFDPDASVYNLVSINVSDFFVSKIYLCGNDNSYISASACNDFFWNGNYFNTSGVYSDTLTNTFGCDSIVQLFLSVIHLDTSISVIATTLKSNAIGATYQWIDCVTHLPLLGETNQFFTPISSGNYAVIVSQAGCTDTSSCISIASVNILNSHFLSFAKLSPNPVTDDLHLEVKLPGENACTITAYNTLGQLVLKEEKHFESYYYGTVNVSRFTEGVYFFKIEAGKKMMATKILKQ